VDPATVWILSVPVAAWALSGVGVAWAFRHSAPTLLLRLAATFLALWSLIATTLALWVLSNGGWPAVVAVARSPAALLPLFGIGDLRLWVEGAAGAFLVLLAAFSLNQLVGRGLLGALHPRPLPWPSRLPRPDTPTTLLACQSARPEAFSFALLTVGPWPRLLRRREIIVVSDALVRLLEPEELEAAIAHELGHVQGLDGRYLTFLRTLARMMRWDPILAFLSRALTRREEYNADEHAVRLTGRPLPLARAIYKASTEPMGHGPIGSTGLLAIGEGRSNGQTADRIRRLLAMAEARPQPEGLGA